MQVEQPQSAGGSPRFLALLDELRSLHLKKSADYGTDADPLSNYRKAARFGVPPWVGVIIRASDKMSRIETFCQKGNLKNEPVRDSLLDLAAHTLIALALFDEAEAEKGA